MAHRNVSKRIVVIRVMDACEIAVVYFFRILKDRQVHTGLDDGRRW